LICINLFPFSAAMDSPSNQPITGFALFADGTLFLKRGYGPQQLQRCRPDHLPANDFKALLWVIEAALGACHNALQFTEPSSIHSLLLVMALSHGPSDPATGMVMHWARPFPIANEFHDQSSGGSVCQPVAGFFPWASLPERVRAARVGSLGLLPKARTAAVA
jgi:hypothetical protein